MKTGEIEEILISIEVNFERLSFMTYTFSDLGKIISKFLEIIIVVLTFIFFFIYALFLEKNSDLLFDIVVVYIAFVTLIVTTTPARDQLLREVEFSHNIKKIENLYSKRKLFKRHYPIIKALIIFKQKNPEINLLQFYNLNKELFTEETLTNLLCNVN
ncbi:MAG: hypothetical protein PVF58_04150 [Candidatus Methanofastidiosia archaeon]|jgi:hypothetical protein